MRTSSKRFVTLVVVSVAALVALSGCAVGNRAPELQSPTPTTQKPIKPAQSSPEPSTIVVSGVALIIKAADGTELSRIPYTSGVDAAISALTTVIGSEPVSKQVPQSSCNLDFTEYDWQGLTLSTSGSSPFRPDKAFVIDVVGASVGDSIAMNGGEGTAVGMSASRLRALPGIEPSEIDGDASFTYDLTPLAGEPGVSSGIYVAVGSDGNVILFRAPHLTPVTC